MPNSAGAEAVRGLGEAGMLLVLMHAAPAHQAWIEQCIFRQGFMQKRHKVALGPDPKVLQALPSEHTAWGMKLSCR